MSQASAEWRAKKLTEQFYRWELRGRGWDVFDDPVFPEPPFRPFTGHWLPDVPPVDDGRRETFLSSLVDRLRRGISPEPPPVAQPPLLPDDEGDEAEPNWLERTELVELVVSLPPKLSTAREVFEQFLANLSLCRQPIAFELVGTHEAVTPQFAAHPSDAQLIRRQLAAYFPEAVLTPRERMLESVWNEASETAIVEFGLAHEFMLPLATGKLDLFIGLTSALAELEPSETALFQVLFQPVRHPWGENMMRAVTGNDGEPLFSNRPELVPGTKLKLARPLYAAVVRIAAGCDDGDRAWEMVCQMAGALRGLTNPHGNALIPLHNRDYPLHKHREDVCRRQSRRSGMLLNSEELLAFVHLPSAAVQNPKLVRDIEKSRAAPQSSRHEGGLLLGTNVHAGRAVEVRLTPEQRVRHMHVIGASGTGKSTLLFNLIRQDIENGQGVAVLDPHGDLVDRVLGIIPPERIADVVLIDPSDEEHSVGFNILAANSDFEKNLLASDLVSVFQRLSTSWGDQMNSVLRNAILAFLESSEGGTLADLRRFLLDAAFRNRFLATVTDPEIVYYWRTAFPQLTGNKSIGPVVTRLDEFLSRKPIRYMVSQKENRVNFAEVIDGGRILLAKLPQGLIGRENSHLLGSLLLSKLQQMAMSRQRMRESERRDFWCYVDEFHCFITPSMAEILTGARKYRVGLTLAHQELRQLNASDEVAGAVLANAFTRVAFRVGDADARSLENGFAHFEARDLQNLEIGEAICRIERSDFDFNLAIPNSEPVDDDEAATMREDVIAVSRAKYARARADIEEELRRKWPIDEPAAPPVKPKPASPVPTPGEPLIIEASEPTTEKPTASEKESMPAVETEPVVIEPVPTVPESAPNPKPPPGLGRGGPGHQLIVANLASEASRLGFRTLKECVVPGGRIDLVIERSNLRMAVEVAAHSNTAQEIENLQKCAEANPDFIVSVSPDENVRDNIARSVARTFDAAIQPKIRVESPDGFVVWLKEMAEKNPEIVPPDSPKPRVIAGRKVRTRHVEMSDEERQKKEAEKIEVIAELLRAQIPKG